MNGLKKFLIALGVVAAFAVLIVVLKSRPAEDNHLKYAGTDLVTDVDGAVREGTYSKYLLNHAEAGYPGSSVDVDIFSYQDAEDVEVKTNYHNEDKVLFTGETSSVTWTVNVPESGIYNVYLEYLAEDSRGVQVERSFKINGELPFSDSENLCFYRIWKDAYAPKTDNQGNQIRPKQEEIFDWQSVRFRDDMGYELEPYQFYFEAGANTLTLDAVNEPMSIRKLALVPVQETATYSEYSASNGGKNATGAGLTYYNLMEGESSARRSEPSLYAKYDKAAANTSPYSVTTTILNYVGGDAWRSSGQWIEWDIEVPEDGYYNIAVKGRQNYARGAISNRSLLIDGEIPFKEVQEIGFQYSNDWEVVELGDDNGNLYNFYLTKGKHTIRLEATLGALGGILQRLEDSTFKLNQIYRTILVYTGASPDTKRDYRIEKVFPEVIEALDLEYKRLYKVVDDTVLYTGQKADQIATAQTIARQMERFVERPEKITREFTAFKDNISAVGTSMLTLSEIKLDIDYVVVKGADAKFEKDKANAFDKIAHEIKAFVASFVVDYNAVGDVYDKNADDVIKVWVATGRDQGIIIKTMIDDTFTPETDIKVNLEIVDAGALLSAVLAGRGPDVVLTVNPDQPVNYALRGAAVDITRFADYKDVLAAYHPASYVQYEYEGGIYGVPETQSFSVLFYRKDVLEELGLDVPKTWPELIEMLPTIQGNSMSVGVPSAAGSSGSALAVSTSGDLTLYFTLLFQYGGEVYNELGSKAIVDSEIGVKALEDYSKYFTDYGIPTIFDFASRFRTGEMPLGVFPYSMYNTLQVSAPEIRGLWDFTYAPGTLKVDENGNEYIDRTSFVSAMATMMIENEKRSEAKTMKAWEFMKWWAAADTQVRYGREIEALLGASSRYNTANREAFKQLAWSAEDIAILDEQWDDIAGIREVPGGYYAGRHVTNAIRKIINEKSDPRETIIDYTIQINDELEKKRKEFNLPME
ncbi:MAG: extracellular solute-binding protein [Lachnospiraceae bacterium]|nr:extracellular solute-binding protein [Lachnospiraceae bacterium]